MKDDDFGMRCRARTKLGKRCKRLSRWLIPICVSRQSWIEALKTGWPRITKGMKEPEYRQVGLCSKHGSCWRPYGDNKINYIYGVGRIGHAKKSFDPEYEEAKRMGDEHVRSSWVRS